MQIDVLRNGRAGVAQQLRDDRDLLPRLMKQVRESVSKRVASATRPSLVLRFQVLLEVAADGFLHVSPGLSTIAMALLWKNH